MQIELHTKTYQRQHNEHFAPHIKQRVGRVNAESRAETVKRRLQKKSRKCVESLSGDVAARRSQSSGVGGQQPKEDELQKKCDADECPCEWVAESRRE